MEIMPMKTKILSVISVAALLLGACHQPEDLVPSEARNGINSITASFPDDTREENSFPSEIDYENGLITIVFPYTYPANTSFYLEKSDLRKVRLEANLDDNVYVEPPLLYMDLTRDDNVITVTDQKKNKKQYRIVAEIRKSNLCAITKYDIPSMNLTGVINEGAKTISFIYDSDIAPVLADVKMSFGAKFDGTDPTKTPVGYSTTTPTDVTVVAQDGVHKATYSVSISAPDILSKGMRYGSEKFLWSVNTFELGVGDALLMGGMAALKDHIVLNTRDQDLVVLNAETGAKEGTIALPFKSNLTNFYCTADNADHILVCNLTPNDGNVFKIWRIDGIAGTPVSYLEFDAGGASLGRKISVYGDIDGDAIITAPVYQGTNSFYRWTVTGGTLNTTPDIVTIAQADMSLWNYNCDVVYTSATDVTADYMMSAYSALTNVDSGNRYHFWMDGKNNTVRYHSPGYSVNWVPNAVDYVVFNGVGFMLSITINGFDWGADDVVYLYDLSQDNLDEPAWESDKGVYGSWANQSKKNANQTGDVALRVSDNGVFMYVYYLFTGGKVGKVQFDCLNM